MKRYQMMRVYLETFKKLSSFARKRKRSKIVTLDDIIEKEAQAKKENKS